MSLLISKNEHRGKIFEKSLTLMKIQIRLQTSHSATQSQNTSPTCSSATN